MQIQNILRSAYNKTIRPHLPRKIGMYHGVAVRQPRLLDLRDVFSDYKKGTVNSVKEAVSTGDTVVEIGTGHGVCSSWAARQGGAKATVFSYEAANEKVAQARETLAMNNLEDRVKVTHAIVGAEKHVYGSSGSASLLSFDQLPNCDVFISDAEGAESDYVDQVSELSPREVVIETHGHRGAQTADIVSSLEKQHYQIVKVIDAMAETPEYKDNKVVHAIENGSN